MLVAASGSLHGANETVTIDAVGGGGIAPYFSNSAGTAQNGYTVRVGAFLSANQSDVQALAYNLDWVVNQFSEFGNGTTETLLSQAGSFDPNPNLTNSSDSFKGEQAWMVYSDNATLGSSTAYGVVSSSSGDWTIPNSSPWTTVISTDQINVTGFGSVSGNGSSDSVRTAAAPSGSLYWDSNGGAGLGGSGTWSSALSATEWTTETGGVSGDGSFAWGSSSGSDYLAGAGLTATFNGTAGTVTVSGTVDTREGLSIESNGYILSSGTIALNGSASSNNTITVTTGSSTISASLSGSNGLTKSGSGNLTLSASNSVSGTVVVDGGELEAGASGALGSATQIDVNGGSLLISASNAVNDSAAIELAGGDLAVSGAVTDTVGVLTLSANSVIDLSGLTGSISFADSSAAVWSDVSLAIWNWNGTNLYGTSYGAGNRQVFFGSDTNGLQQSQLDKISFYSDSGSTFIGNAYLRSNGEIAAVPEPAVVVTAVLLLGWAGVVVWRRRAIRGD
jgi:autotransporter-associated beta strand protein